MSGKSKATDATAQAVKAGQQPAEKVTSVVKRGGEAAGAALKQPAVAISDAAEKGPTQVPDEAAEKITSVVKRGGTEAAGATFKQAAVAISDATEKGTTQVTDEAAEKVTSVVERGGEAGAAFRQAAVAVSGAAEKGQKQATQSMAKVMKTAEEFVSFNQGNLEALIKSGQILATGMQDLGKQVAATAQARL